MSGTQSTPVPAAQGHVAYEPNVAQKHLRSLLDQAEKTSGTREAIGKAFRTLGERLLVVLSTRGSPRSSTTLSQLRTDLGNQALRIEPLFKGLFLDEKVAVLGDSLVELALSKISESVKTDGLTPKEAWGRVVDQCIDETVEKARMALESLLLWLETLGFTPVFENWVTRTMCRYSTLFLADRYEDYMKYITATVQARGLDFSIGTGADPSKYNAEVPSKPKWLSPKETHFLGGSAYLWFVSRTGRLGGSRKQSLAMLNSITGLKKRQPEIPATKLAEKTRDWFPSLFNEGGRNPTLGVWSAPFKSVAEEVVEYLAEARTRDTKVRVPLPALAARLHAKKTQGGAYGKFSVELMTYLLDPDDPLDRYVPNHEPVLGTITDAGLANVYEISGVIPDVTVSMLELLQFELPVVPQALPEPFKVRMISKSTWISQWQASVLQKFMHTLIQGLPELRLTRETPDHDIEDILTEVVGVSPCPPDERNVSGDYTGATDNLLSECSSVLADAIVKRFRLTRPVSAFLKASLVGHVIRSSDIEATVGKEYADDVRARLGAPDSFPGDPEPTWTQKWGQLMGSPTSFPFLCLANLVLTLIGLRSVEGSSARPLGQTGIVINGDDIAFRAKMDAIAAWRAATKAGGLSPSLGKNFMSVEFLQINSKMFVIENGRWTLIHTASLAVLAPPRKVEFAEFCLSGPAWQRQFLGTSVQPERGRLNRMWHSVWMPQLRELPSELMNWYVPRCLGGFGLEPSDDTWILTDRQAHIAAYFRDHITYDSFKDSQLAWDQPQANTSAQDDARIVMDNLVQNGLMVYGFLPDQVKEVVIPDLTASLVLSGWAVSWNRARAIPRSNEGVPPEFQIVINDPQKDSPEAIAVLAFQPLPVGWTSTELVYKSVNYWRAQGELVYRMVPKPRSRNSWLPRTIRRLKTAASATSRSMSRADVLAYKGRTAGFYLPDHLTFTPGLLGMEVRTMRRSLTESDPDNFTIRDPFSAYSNVPTKVPLGPVTYLTSYHSERMESSSYKAFGNPLEGLSADLFS